MPNSRRMYKGAGVYPSNAKLLSNKKEWFIDTYNSMGVSWNNYTEWKKPDQKEDDSTDKNSRKFKLIHGDRTQILACLLSLLKVSLFADPIRFAFNCAVLSPSQRCPLSASQPPALLFSLCTFSSFSYALSSAPSLTCISALPPELQTSILQGLVDVAAWPSQAPSHLPSPKSTPLLPPPNTASSYFWGCTNILSATQARNPGVLTFHSSCPVYHKPYWSLSLNILFSPEFPALSTVLSTWGSYYLLMNDRIDILQMHQISYIPGASLCFISLLNDSTSFLMGLSSSLANLFPILQKNKAEGVSPLLENSSVVFHCSQAKRCRHYPGFEST